jgi:site-specific recombinase XerD
MGLLCGLTKIYSVNVAIWKTQWTLGAVLSQYRAWLATTRRYTERSKREYLDDVSEVVDYLETRCRIRSVTAVQRQHLIGFLDHCAAAGHATGTRRRSVAAIRAFFSFLVQRGILRTSPAEYLLPPERETRPPRVLTEAEYQRLRGAASDNLRDLAIIELVLQTGLRLSEIARLTMSDIILPAVNPRFSLPVGHVRIAGRGAHSRTVTLNIRACEALSSYLAEREETGSPSLFLTKFGLGIGPRGIENIVTKNCKEAAITAASVHSLRHTMAVKMLRRGATPAVVGKALGHASSDTMAVYTDLARERMDEEMQKAAL